MLQKGEMQRQAVLCPGRRQWGLLDDGVHGRDALGHDQRLAVGDVVEGRARVTGQNHLGKRCQETEHSQALPSQVLGLFPVWQRRVLLVGSDTSQQLPKLQKSSQGKALTSVPLERSSRTKGKTPKIMSIPLLSAKIKAHL